MGTTTTTVARVLTPEERRLLVDALRAAAAETRRAKTKAVTDCHRAFSTKQQAHIDHLSRLSWIQDKLATELNEYEIRIERLAS